MLSKTLITALGPLCFAFATATAAETLPPCSKTDQPCSCPSGSTFRNTTSRAVIGAPAQDIGAVTNDYFNVTWCGLELKNSTGQDNQVGAIRYVAAIGGDIVVTEELDDMTVDDDGSFVHKFSQVMEDGKPQIIVPADAPGGPIGLAGYWNTFTVKQNPGHKGSESSVMWNEYRCDIGDPFSSAAFQQYAINSTISILQSQGKLTGRTTYPYTEATQG